MSKAKMKFRNACRVMAIMTPIFTLAVYFTFNWLCGCSNYMRHCGYAVVICLIVITLVNMFVVPALQKYYISKYK